MSGTLRNSIVYISFKINQQYIIENLCIERVKQINNCNGNCQLMKELEKNLPQGPEAPLPTTENNHPILLYFTDNKINITPDSYLTNSQYNDYNQLIISNPYARGIFRPPKA